MRPPFDHPFRSGGGKQCGSSVSNELDQYAFAPPSVKLAVKMLVCLFISCGAGK